MMAMKTDKSFRCTHKLQLVLPVLPLVELVELVEPVLLVAPQISGL